MSLRKLALACITMSMMACTDNKRQTESSLVHFISKDSANKMIGSYLENINYPTNTTDLQSIIFDVAELKQYLNSPEATGMTHLKIMFAHTLDFINSDGSGNDAGYENGKLTLVLAGYDGDGDYIYYSDNMVMEYGTPCPTNCASGEAASPLFPSSTAP